MSEDDVHAVSRPRVLDASYRTILRSGVAVVATLATVAVAVPTLVAGPSSAIEGGNDDTVVKRPFEWDRVTKKAWINSRVNCNMGSLPYVSGCFHAKGEHLQVADNRADGKSVGMHWKTNYGRRGVCITTHGRDGDQGWLHQVGNYICNKNMKNNKKIKFRVGRCNVSASNCRKLKNWNKWSGWSSWFRT